MVGLVQAGDSVGPALASPEAADRAVAVMEERLVAAVEAERVWREGHAGSQHPLFEDPAGAMWALGEALEATRKRHHDRREVQSTLDGIEEEMLNRVCFMA